MKNPMGIQATPHSVTDDTALGLARGLSNRHLQLIAICGAI